MCSSGSFAGKGKRLLAGTVFVLSAFGQTLVEPERIPPVKRVFDAAPGPPLRCEVHPMPPTLDFSFRFSTGYMVDIPLAQVRGSGHALKDRKSVVQGKRVE